MSQIRNPTMLPGFNSSMGGAGNLGGLNGIGSMANLGGMGGLGGLGNVGGMGGMAGGHQQQHSAQPPMGGALPNHLQQQPPMGALQPGPSGSQLPNHMPGQMPGGQTQGQQNQQALQHFMRLQQQQQQHRLQQQQHQQQHQQQQQQQQQQPQQQHLPQQGPSGLGMSPMASLGASRMAGSAVTGNAMASMGGLNPQGGLAGAPGFQGMAPGMQAGMRRVPSQTGQHGQPPPQGVGNSGMNMNMINAMSGGGLGGSVGMNGIARPGGMPGQTPGPGAQRMPPFQGTGPQGPGQLQPAGSGPGGMRLNHQQVSPEFANIFQQQRLQDSMAAQVPRAGSVPGPSAPIGQGGPMHNTMGGAQMMQRAPSAQSIGTPALASGGMHPNLPNHTLQGHNQQHPLNQQGPPPFTNPLQNAQIQQQPQQLPIGQHPLGQHGHPRPPSVQGVPMQGVPGPHSHHVAGPGAGPTMGGSLPGQPGQQHMQGGSPQRPGTGMQHTPILAPGSGGVRPHSRMSEQQQQSMLGYGVPSGQPQYGAPMRQGMQTQMGQPGLTYGGPQGMGMGAGERPGPQQNAMQPLGSSPPGARPGSATGGPRPGSAGVGVMSTPNPMASLAVRPGNGPPQGSTGFPTPAQQLADQQARGGLAGGPLTGGAVGLGRGQVGPQLQRPASRSMQPPGQLTFVNQQLPGGGPGQGPGPGGPQPGMVAINRQGTPMQPPHPRPPTGPPTPAQAHGSPHGQGYGSPRAGLPPQHPMHRTGPQPMQQLGGQQQQQQQLHGPPHLVRASQSPLHTGRPSSRQQSQQPQPLVHHPPGAGAQPPMGPSQTPRTPQASLPAVRNPTPGPSVPQGPMGAIPGRPGGGGAGMPNGLVGAQTAQQHHPPPLAAAIDGPAGGPALQNSVTPSPTVQHAAYPYMRVSRPPPGVALSRLMALSDRLSQPRSLTKDYWESVVTDFFSPKAVVKMTLWNAQQEAKPFEISMPILSRFFLVTSQSGVISTLIHLENVEERPGLNASVLDCTSACWTYYYRSGYVVALRGNLQATLSIQPSAGSPQQGAGMNGAAPPVYKFDNLTFNAKTHEKLIRIDRIEGRRGEVRERPARVKAEPSPMSTGSGSSPPQQQQEDDIANMNVVIPVEDAMIPPEPVNAFGIPQAAMRCLELAESVGHMAELMEYSLRTNFGPIEALKNYAQMLRDRGGTVLPAHQSSPGHTMDGSMMNGVATSPSVTLYQSSPSTDHVPSSSGSLQAPVSTTQRSSSAASPPHMATTPASAPTPNAPPMSANTASGSVHSTPMTPHATLKRKAGEINSPVTASSEQAPPPPKRAQRKRSVRQNNPG